MMHKLANRIVPTDVLKSKALQETMSEYMYEDDVDVDPVEPSMSPQIMYRPSPRIATTAVVAAATATSSRWLPAWLSWKVALFGVVVAIVMYVCVRYWRLMRTRGVSYAFAAAIPPLRPLMAPFAGVSSDVMLAEIEAFQLPPPPPPILAKPKPKVKIQSPQQKSVAQPQPQIDRAALLEQLLADGLNNGHSTQPENEDAVQSTPSQQPNAGNTQRA
jgi:hypothetical protein